jgi:hypothetical protein
MKRQQWFATIAALSAILASTDRATAQYGAKVVSYTPGSTAASGLNNLSAAIGPPTRLIGNGPFEGAVTPFNSPFKSDQILSIGVGGQITLRLSNYALASAAAPQLGLFGHAGLVAATFPDVISDSIPSLYSDHAADVAISENGQTWVSLGNVNFNIPTNGYTDLTDPFSPVAGSALSDFQQPFTSPVTSFASLPYADPNGPDILEVLNGSGGGNWLDISGKGLSQVAYVRFSLPNGAADPNVHFELDAVSIAHGAVGAAAPEPSTLLLAGETGIVLCVGVRRLRAARNDRH